MRWQNKGHEYDRKAHEYIELFCERGEKYYVFGAGYLGGEVKSVLERIGCFAGYIDNDIRKQKTSADGGGAMSLEQYMCLEHKGIIVIAVDQKYAPDIEEQLTEKQLQKGRHYFIWDEFLRRVLPILMAYYFDQVYVELAQISVTERCSLRCKKCAHACNYVGRDVEDMAIDTVCYSADSFFSKVDLCREFVLIGGEPLLYRELPRAVAYIGERYRGKIVHFCITTNGTILPNEELLRVCRQYQVMFRISNYSKQLPHLAGKYRQLTELLDRNGITYILGDADEEWMDYGFETVNRCESAAELQNVFDQCRTPCRKIRGSRYYYCVMARSVSENMGMKVGAEDFLDLEKLPADYRKIWMEFELGYSEKGYLDMCGHCNGAEAVYMPIPAAEQVKG